MKPRASVLVVFALQRLGLDQLLSGIVQQERFSTEELLGVSFANLLRGTQLSKPTGFLREFDCGSGIADFVLFQLHPRFDKRLNIGQINPRYLFALRSLPVGKTFSEIAFARRILASRSTTRKLLSQFQHLGYCRPAERAGLWKKLRQVQPILTHLCGIEAKLTDWRRALFQANRYKEFAHQAWVLLDYHALDRALPHLELFAELNIGLAGIDSAAGLDIHLSPTFSEPRSGPKFWQANAQIASILLKRSPYRALATSAQADR